MPTEALLRSRLWRGVALAGITAAGIVGIVGSGGGVPDCLFCGGVQVPIIDLSVGPGSQGAQVGETVEFHAFAWPNAAASGPLTYTWCRSQGGVGPCLAIAGGNDQKLTLVGVNLADNGAVFMATVRGVNASATARATLYVSNTPPVSYHDGDFLPADWSASADAGAASAPAPRIQRAATGGNPGAFRHAAQQIPATRFDASYFNESRTGVYDPGVQGAAYGIEFEFDVVLLVPLGGDVAYYGMAVGPLIGQGARKYRASESAWGGPPFAVALWTAASGAKLGLPRQPAENFHIIDGPPCHAGEACPDFSAGAPPLRFGYEVTFTVPYGAPGAPSLEYGIDNFKVTVWRR